MAQLLQELFFVREGVPLDEVLQLRQVRWQQCSSVALSHGCLRGDGRDERERKKKVTKAQTNKRQEQSLTARHAGRAVLDPFFGVLGYSGQGD